MEENWEGRRRIAAVVEAEAVGFNSLAKSSAGYLIRHGVITSSG